MRWTKLGLVVPSPPPVPWAETHAMVPFVEQSEQSEQSEQGVRLYFSSRDESGRSVTGVADLDPTAPESVEFGPALLARGALGAFDDSGAMGSCMVAHQGKKLLYYIGWSRGITVPFTTLVGLAASADGGQTFERLSQAPLLERSSVDPFLTTSPWVLVEGDRWRMWYASGVRWEADGERPKHFYNIRHAESVDGISWRREGHVCIDFRDDEYAISRPCVVASGGRYRMWYSYRGDAYRIGYAESDDGLEWERKDEEAGIDVSPEGWDSEMIEYPCVFEHQGAWYMLYNGNGYGATGIGLAVLNADG